MISSRIIILASDSSVCIGHQVRVVAIWPLATTLVLILVGVLALIATRRRGTEENAVVLAPWRSGRRAVHAATAVAILALSVWASNSKPLPEGDA